VKLLKMFGLAALAALMAMAFAGTGSAMAESTALCLDDPQRTACPDDIVRNVHDTTVSKAKLLSSLINVECDVLFSGEVLSELATNEPLLIDGRFTYSNCNSGCTVTQEGTGNTATTSVLRTGHETAEVTYEFQTHVKCGAFIDCIYNGEGMLGTAKGPLLASHLNGEITFSEQTMNKVGGLFCPKTTKLDITTTPSELIYIHT
jgi:hypothetical protein